MIKPLKTNRIAFLFYLFVGIVFFFGCRTQEEVVVVEVPLIDHSPPQYRIIPITDSIIAEVGGLDNAKEFQYYISKAITLKRNNTAPKGDVVNGELVRTIFTNRDTIRIEANTPGVMKSHPPRQDPGYGSALNIAFEDLQGNPNIGFGKWPPLGTGSNGRYQIIYTDAENLIINYGGINYNVSYDGHEPPYLMIRFREVPKENVDFRIAPGLLLGSPH